MRIFARVMSLVSFFLMVIGALNWLLVGTAKFDLVRWIFGRQSIWGRIIYSLVGTAGVNELTNFVIRTIRTRVPSPATP